MHNIGLMGFGTVGTGVYEIINNKKGNFHKNFPNTTITKILVQNLNKDRKVICDKSILTNQADDLLNDSNIHTLIFNMGGLEPSFSYMQKAILKGKNIITANKAVVAPNLKFLTDLANKHNVHFLYEASTGGGIPIIGPLKKQLHINEVTHISGILNGTCNYILSKMFSSDSSFADTLKDAQDLGFAEADPTDDVDAYDTSRKIGILSSIAYKTPIDLNHVSTRGIRSISAVDVEFLKSKNATLKLLGISALENDHYAIMAEPVVVSNSNNLSLVDDAFNQVNFHGSLIQDLSFKGLGAGQFPTANAIVCDLMDILSASDNFHTDFSNDNIKHDSSILSFSYYVRFTLKDEYIDNNFLNIIGQSFDEPFELLHEGSNYYIKTSIKTRDHISELVNKLSEYCSSYFYAALLDSNLAVI